MTIENKRLTAILVIIVAILLVPLIGMRFTNEINWSPADFILMGTLLLGTGLLCEWVLRSIKKTMQRIILCATILMALLLTWAELAVGIFGTPFAGS